MSEGGEREPALRLFVGARISVGGAQDLQSTVESMQPMARAEEMKVRWLSPATYHLTLKFLGWCRPEIEATLIDVLAPAVAGCDPFRVELSGLGAFPSEKKARVLWAGVAAGAAELSELASRIDAATAELGFPPERRDYHPHVTFARLEPPADASGLILPFSEDRFRASRIDRVVLFQSVTRSSGAEYTARAELPLSGGQGQP